MFLHDKWIVLVFDKVAIRRISMLILSAHFASLSTFGSISGFFAIMFAEKAQALRITIEEISILFRSLATV